MKIIYLSISAACFTLAICFAVDLSNRRSKPVLTIKGAGTTTTAIQTAKSLSIQDGAANEVLYITESDILRGVKDGKDIFEVSADGKLSDLKIPANEALEIISKSVRQIWSNQTVSQKRDRDFRDQAMELIQSQDKIITKQMDLIHELQNQHFKTPGPALREEELPLPEKEPEEPQSIPLFLPISEDTI